MSYNLSAGSFRKLQRGQFWSVVWILLEIVLHFQLRMRKMGRRRAEEERKQPLKGGCTWGGLTDLRWCILHTLAHFAHICKHTVPTASAHSHKLDATCYKLKLTKPHHCKVHLKRLDWPHPSQMMHVAVVAHHITCCTEGKHWPAGQAGILIIRNIVHVHTTLIRAPVDTKWVLCSVCRKSSFFNWGSSQHSDPSCWCKPNCHKMRCTQYHNSLDGQSISILAKVAIRM